ncbi:hypothetical protein [Cupriavidus taiwanensis]|uniref:hypothetical protein n=1 Tax=Cupriavidus taiwanensis TaxID=164546 RepID=UPI000E133E6E|nr:hypothetical protein [Cupriavidus taiwanensis]SPA44859.1 hypothetical protein CBM2629_A170086 [Cupriavidus taiwanensis]
MDKHLKRFLVGVRQVLVISPPVEYQRPGKKGFSRDAEALRGDARKVGKNLRKTINRHGEPVYHR